MRCLLRVVIVVVVIVVVIVNVVVNTYICTSPPPHVCTNFHKNERETQGSSRPTRPSLGAPSRQKVSMCVD